MSGNFDLKMWVVSSKVIPSDIVFDSYVVLMFKMCVA